MKCTFKEADFRPAWRAIQWAQSGPCTANWDNEEWLTAILRVEASNGTLSLVGPWGQASCPAQIEEPGVLFISIREFVDSADYHAWDDDPLELVADEKRFLCSGCTSFSIHIPMIVFDDPATAPQTWEPPEESDEDDDDEWYDDEADDEADAPAPADADAAPNQPDEIKDRT